LEGPKNLKLNKQTLPKTDQLYLLLVIIAFHFVGLIGFYSSFSHSLFLLLVPWHLLLMLAVVGGSHRPADLKFLLFAAIIYVGGFFVEWEGLHAKVLFGDYGYTNILGNKLDSVPLCIGINWFLLIYSTGITMKKSRIRSMTIRIICGALLLVVLDILIEPVAIKLGYWYWMNNIIPFRKYVTWFGVSAAMLTVFELFKFKRQGIVAPVFLLVQFIFFAVLWLTI
jgi:putative membrane protein